MSRSYRRTPIHGISTARSEKDDKKLCHGMMRAIERARLATAKTLSPDEMEDFFIVEDYNDVMNVWAMAKDGKSYWGDPVTWSWCSNPWKYTHK